MKFFYIIFSFAVLVDVVITPSIGPLVWLPKFFLATIPFIFLFGRLRGIQFIFLFSVLFFWLTTNINLGIIVFSYGAMFFFERWVVLKFFQKDAWQTTLISSLGVLVFGFFLFLTIYFLTPQDFFLNGGVVVSFALTALLAAVLTFFFKRIISIT